MKNWKTTLVACVLAALVAGEPFINNHAAMNKQTILQMIFAMLIAGLGLVAGDYNGNGTNPPNPGS